VGEEMMHIVSTTGELDRLIKVKGNDLRPDGLGVMVNGIVTANADIKCTNFLCMKDPSKYWRRKVITYTAGIIGRSR
jgi:hypothetical protein